MRERVITCPSACVDISVEYNLYLYSDPNLFEISLDEGGVSVVCNDRFPERVGRQIITELQADDSEKSLWRGQVYAEKLGEYKTAELSLKKPDLMQFKVRVGFISRTIEWVRVYAVPAAVEQE